MPRRILKVNKAKIVTAWIEANKDQFEPSSSRRQYVTPRQHQFAIYLMHGLVARHGSLWHIFLTSRPTEVLGKADTRGVFGRKSPKNLVREKPAASRLLGKFFEGGRTQ